MAGIAGIASPGRDKDVKKMLSRIRHRGLATKTVENGSATLGVVYNKETQNISQSLETENLICDEVGEGHFACVKTNQDAIVLSRDPLGVVPLYYGWDSQGALCFASEVKALLAVTQDIHELVPGTRLVGEKVEKVKDVHPSGLQEADPHKIAEDLRMLLDQAVEKRVALNPHFGSLLSGGLDSSVISALARPYIKDLHTFSSVSGSTAA